MTDKILAIILIPLLVAVAATMECLRWGCGHVVRLARTVRAKRTETVSSGQEEEAFSS